MTANTLRKILWLLIVAGLCAALYSTAQRWRVERHNRSVEITLDWAQVRDAAVASGASNEDALRQFHNAGVTSIALTEDTVSSLDESHRMTVSTLPAFGGVALEFPDPADAGRVTDALRVKARVITQGRVSAGSGAVRLSTTRPYSSVRGVGIGLDPYLVNLIQKSGLQVVGRVNNITGVRPDSLRWTLQELKRQQVRTVIFSGDEMLGYKGYLTNNSETPGQATTQSALDKTGLNLGVVEFGKQKGDAALPRASQNHVVRVHTITGTEMVAADIESTIQRFLLGARERNIRLLYVRLFLDEPDPLAVNVKWVGRLADGLEERGGLSQGPSHPYDALTTPVYLRVPIGIAVAAGWLLLVNCITGFLEGWAGRALGLVRFVGWGGAALLLLLSLAPGLLGAKLLALAAACIFPSLALLHRDLLAPAHNENALGVTLSRFTVACAITVIGIICIVGLLADRLFLIKADAFVGIKPAQALPLLLVALVYIFGLRARADRSFSDALGEASRRVTGWARDPIRWWQIVAGILVLVVVFLLMARSGNDPGVGVSDLELKFRGLLDRLLYVRPRSKEFALGHPALVLALIWASQGRRQWALPVFLLGVIGQVSLLNTFLHLHTPLWVGLSRALLGLVIGVIIGLILHSITRRLVRPAPVALVPTQTH